MRRCPTAAPASISRIRDGRIAAIERAIAGEAGARDRRAGLPRRAAFRRHPFPHGRDALARLPRLNQSGTLLEGIALWGELKPLLTPEAVAERALRYCDLAVVARAAGDPQPCRHLRRPAHRGRCAARREAQDRALYRSAARGVSAGRLFPLGQCGEEPGARARQGRRRGRRHSAFRAHHGGRRALDRGAVRHRGRARPDGRHALRRDRRSAVAPHRDARRRDAAARPARPRHRLAPHLDAQHGQLLCLEAAAADGGSAGARGRQPADQHRAAGPPRHLSEAARPDARAGNARARHQRGVRPRLRDGPVVLARLRRHARCRAHGAACRADDRARGDALLLRGGDDERREGDGA